MKPRLLWMKPRMLPEPPTLEDWEICKHLEIMDQPRWLQIMDLMDNTDRRDADLMLAAQMQPLAIRIRRADDRSLIELRGLPVGWERVSVAAGCLPFDIIN